MFFSDIVGCNGLDGSFIIYCCDDVICVLVIGGFVVYL